MKTSDSIKERAEIIAPALENIAVEMSRQREEEESRRREVEVEVEGVDNEGFFVGDDDDNVGSNGYGDDDDGGDASRSGSGRRKDLVEVAVQHPDDELGEERDKGDEEQEEEEGGLWRVKISFEDGNKMSSSGDGNGLWGFWKRGKVSPIQNEGDGASATEHFDERSSIANGARKKNNEKKNELHAAAGWKEETKEKDEEEEKEEERERQKWSNPIEFLLSCVAMSVGLGNVWRFPFTAYENGGGAFLFPYLVVLIFVGRPLYFLELAMGQFASTSSARVWNMVPAARGVGYGQIIANASVVSYYTSLIALSLYYLVASCQSALPWMHCDPNIQINGTICVDSSSNVAEALRELQGRGVENVTKMGSAEQYFLHKVLKEKASIGDGLGLPDWKLVLCLLACYVMLFLTLWKGVATSGKASYFTALFPYVVLITLAVKAVTLPGSDVGILLYFKPDFQKIFTFKVWYEAVTQMFFSLSVGFGSLITYSSYNNFRHNTYRDALIISFTDTFTSMLAGFVIFGVLGNLAHELDVDVREVVKSGTGLAFISYPMAIGKFSWYPQVFAVLFFLMLMTLGLGSATGMMTGVITVVCDDFPTWKKPLVALFTCVAGFAVGIVYVTPGGQYIVELVDYYGGGFIIFALTTLEVVAVSWVYGLGRFVRDIHFMLGRRMGFYWRLCWGFVIPVALIVMLAHIVLDFSPVEYAGKVLPQGAQVAGIALVLLALLQVPLWAVYAAFMQKGDSCKEKLLGSFRPNVDWGPKEAIHRAEWEREEAEFHMEKIRVLQEKASCTLNRRGSRT